MSSRHSVSELGLEEVALTHPAPQEAPEASVGEVGQARVREGLVPVLTGGGVHEGGGELLAGFLEHVDFREVAGNLHARANDCHVVIEELEGSGQPCGEDHARLEEVWGLVARSLRVDTDSHGDRLSSVLAPALEGALNVLANSDLGDPALVKLAIGLIPQHAPFLIGDSLLEDLLATVSGGLDLLGEAPGEEVLLHVVARKPVPVGAIG